jgi:thiamine pyrophosphokinase
VANFQTLQFLADRDAFGILCGITTMASVIQNGTLTFPSGCSGTVSVFCMGADACGVSLKGLYYPLENGTLTAGFPLGVSNHFTGETAEISVETGSLLVIWERKDGLPDMMRKR